jgi:hypothetical protein
LGTAATTGLLYQPRMIGDGDCEEIGGMKIGRGNRSTRRKPVPAPLCLPQIPHDYAVGSQRLTAWAMARPDNNHYSIRRGLYHPKWHCVSELTSCLQVKATTVIQIIFLEPFQFLLLVDGGSWAPKNNGIRRSVKLLLALVSAAIPDFRSLRDPLLRFLYFLRHVGISRWGFRFDEALRLSHRNFSTSVW